MCSDVRITSQRLRGGSNKIFQNAVKEDIPLKIIRDYDTNLMMLKVKKV
jgi:hypothetical protein